MIEPVLRGIDQAYNVQRNKEIKEEWGQVTDAFEINITVEKQEDG